MIGTMRVYGLEHPVASAPRLPKLLSGDVPWGEAGLPPASHWPDGRGDETWETLSYVMLWICGLWGIGLCFS
jgi:hypothetical protein